MSQAMALVVVLAKCSLRRFRYTDVQETDSENQIYIINNRRSVGSAASFAVAQTYFLGVSGTAK